MGGEFDHRIDPVDHKAHGYLGRLISGEAHLRNTGDTTIRFHSEYFAKPPINEKMTFKFQPYSGMENKSVWSFRDLSKRCTPIAYYEDSERVAAFAVSHGKGRAVFSSVPMNIDIFTGVKRTPYARFFEQILEKPRFSL